MNWNGNIVAERMVVERVYAEEQNDVD